MAETRKWLRNAGDGSHSLAEDILILIGRFVIL